jgi:2-polyprenyl-6-methoxyphenol hydroxylase-like FAD-dependent oxidoreductase
VEDAIRAAGLPPERARYIIWARTLAGEEIERRVPWRSTETARAVSPVRNCLCAQDDLEPVLRTFAEQLRRGELRFNTELIAFAQDADGVTATLRDRGSGAEGKVRARYVIAADGARSRIRETLGITMQGQADVYQSVNILLRADLRRWTADRPAALYFIENETIKGTFLTINGHDRWGFLVNNPTALGLSPVDFTPEQCVRLIRMAAGVPDLPVEILGAVPWTASARVAERYRDGRIFLAGDAAHEMPPTGGFGLNTGVQDVHNLTWKLAEVIEHPFASGLLDTYEAERLPVGRAITEQSLANSASMGRVAGQSAQGNARPEYLNEQGMIFGAVYDSSIIVPDGTPPPPVTNPVTEYAPVARPGHRAPHLWLDTAAIAPRRNTAATQVSPLDLFGPHFTLLAGPTAELHSVATKAAEALRVTLYPATVGGDGEATRAFLAAYGIEPDGAVLVRPDGHVAWRRRTAAAPGPGLGEALAIASGRAPARAR